MGKITEYPQTTELLSENVFLIDGPDGTQIITGENLPYAVLNLAAVELHRTFFRGKNLGTVFTDEQKANIQNGSFKDLWVGDYWQSGNIKYRVADIDYWYNTGDTAFTKHHLVIVPDTNLYSAQMHNTESGAYEAGEANTTVGGYTGSDMYLTNLERAKTMITEFFGDALLTHREYLTNAVSSGYPSAGAWFDSNVELMNEPMVYGSYIFTPAGNGSRVVNRYTISKQQLALFALCPKLICNRSWYWLRDVVSSAPFANVGGDGNATYRLASNSNGVRPAFPVG